MESVAIEERPDFFPLQHAIALLAVKPCPNRYVTAHVPCLLLEAGSGRRAVCPISGYPFIRTSVHFFCVASVRLFVAKCLCVPA